MKETCTKQVMRYEGKIFSVTSDEVSLENGQITQRDVVHHHGGVCIAACDTQGYYYLVRQFRYGVQADLLEFPAGKLEKDEDPLHAAHRELEEEIGYRCEHLISLGSIDLSPAYLTEKIYLYEAGPLNYVGQNLDEHEYIDLVKMNLDELIVAVDQQQITDAKTIALVLRLLINKDRVSDLTFTASHQK